MKEVTFQKKNGEIVKKYMFCPTLPYRIGYINTYGWQVIDIKYCFNGKYYPLEKYEALENFVYAKNRLLRSLKTMAIKGIYNLSCFFILLIVSRIINTIMNF